MDIGQIVESIQLGLFVMNNLTPAPCLDARNHIVAAYNFKDFIKMSCEETKTSFKNYMAFLHKYLDC